MLTATAEKFGIPLQPYGVGEPCSDWIEIKVTRLLKKLRELQADGYTHVLYTDGRDSLFASDPNTIGASYGLYCPRPPCLISGEENCYPCSEFASLFLPTKTGRDFPCAGQFIGEIDWILEKWQELQERYAGKVENNDQAWIIHGVVDGVLGGMRIDTHCNVFINIQQPCDPTAIRSSVWHFSGGFMDPETGREERMRPYFDAIMSK